MGGESIPRRRDKQKNSAQGSQTQGSRGKQSWDGRQYSKAAAPILFQTSFTVRGTICCLDSSSLTFGVFSRKLKRFNNDYDLTEDRDEGFLLVGNLQQTVRAGLYAW